MPGIKLWPETLEAGEKPPEGPTAGGSWTISSAYKMAILESALHFILFKLYKDN